MIRPIAVDDTVMTSVNVPEDDAPEWSSGDAPYANGDRVIKTVTHLVYESLVDDNGDDPEEGVELTAPSWAVVGATRPWRIYDERVRNASRALEPYDPAVYHAYDDAQTANGIALTLTPGAFVDSVALLNISGVFAHVIVETPADGRIYEKREPLSGGLEESNWHSYFNTPIDRRTQLILTDLPTALDAVIRVAVEEVDHEAQIGELIAGRSVNLGNTQWGSGTSIIDYSKKERDEWGNLRIVERRYTKVADYRIRMDRRITDTVAQVLADVRAQPTLFVGVTWHTSLVVYGIYRNMRITFENHAFSEATIEVEEV
ncbi:hypothetical protein [Halomonas organivorans]|uniref:Uncharacterized protein n=1 Tax=Halomonas organivorans TaxID=257772 RepID=A0A7W5BZZ2_9GAMM|nr:hypothetical protein [Halomonas organivorans]MBB3142185.1 hypothetical protein [Halomonas organivorans]